MPITLELLRNGRVLLRTLTDPLDAGEMLDNFRMVARDIIKPSPHRIHIIFDATNLHKLPNNLLSFWRSAEKVVIPKTGNIIIVSDSGFLKTMTALVNHVTHLRPYSVSTLAEAFALVDRWLVEEMTQIPENNHTENVSDR